ncbi:MAG: hypothetical protein ACOYNR_06455, partial [Blastocatellia bacterium]
CSYGKFCSVLNDKARENEIQDGAGIFLCLEAGVSPELISGIPDPLFERSGSSVFLGRGDSIDV